MLLALLTTASAQPPEGAAVNGFGGFFLRSENPKALATWYLNNLGISRTPRSYEQLPWMQEAGPTVFSPFPDIPNFLNAGDRPFVLNFRTRDLNALVAHLRDNGTEVELDATVYPNGRFALLQDPDGNPIQLWEPAEPKEAAAEGGSTQ
ncbi:MAG: VOC family protein [Pseudomonadota bacterium]